MTKTLDAIRDAARVYARSCIGRPENPLYNQFVHEVSSNPAKFDDLFELLADDTSRRILDWAIKWRLAAFFTQSRETASVMYPPWISGFRHSAMLSAAKEIPEAALEGNLDVDLIENYILNGYNLPGLCEVGNSDIVLDCGAFNGNSSIVFARLCPNGRVFAFEPNPRA